MAEGTGNNLFLKFYLSHQASNKQQLIHKLARPIDLRFTAYHNLSTVTKGIQLNSDELLKNFWNEYISTYWQKKIC